MKNSFKLHALLILILASTLTIGIWQLGSSAIKKVNQVESRWALYTKNAADASYTLERILSQIGYGGFIHQFKNMILRQDLEQFDEIELLLQQSLADISTYKAYDLTKEEWNSLIALENALNEYNQKLFITRDLIQQGYSSVSIDQQVKVDDSTALEALNLIKKAALERSNNKQREMSEIIEQAMGQLYAASFIVPAIMISALMMIVFLYRLSRANKLTEESNLFFDRLLEAAPDALMTVADDGSITRINRTAVQLTGYSSAELSEMKLEQLLPARYRREHRHHRQGFFDRPKNRAMQGSPSLLLQHKDGHEIDVEISLSYLQLDGKTTAIAIIRDVTERKNADQKLKEREAQLLNAQRIAHLGSWTLDLTTEQMSWSEEVFRIMTITEDSEQPPNLQDYVASSNDRERNKLLLLLSSGCQQSHYRMERKITCANNQTRFLREQGMFEYNEAKQPIRVIGTVQDITEEKLAHRSLEQSAAVFEHISDAVIVTNSRKKIIAVNRAFTKITGYSKEESVGQDPGFTKSGRHPDNFYHQMNEAVRIHGSWQGEIWDRRKNGEIYPKWLNITQITRKDKKSYYIGVFSDISQQKETEEQLRYQALHDPLTGLPNRLSLHEQLDHTIKHASRIGSMVGVLFLDLDRFKMVNDSLGHPVGDELLKHVANTLLKTVKSDDIVARLSGDEFMWNNSIRYNF